MRALAHRRHRMDPIPMHMNQVARRAQNATPKNMNRAITAPPGCPANVHASVRPKGTKRAITEPTISPRIPKMISPVLRDLMSAIGVDRGGGESLELAACDGERDWRPGVGTRSNSPQFGHGTDVTVAWSSTVTFLPHCEQLNSIMSSPATRSSTQERPYTSCSSERPFYRITSTTGAKSYSPMPWPDRCLVWPCQCTARICSARPSPEEKHPPRCRGR